MLIFLVFLILLFLIARSWINSVLYVFAGVFALIVFVIICLIKHRKH